MIQERILQGLRPRVTVEQQGDVTRTREETLLYRGLKAGGEIAGRVVGDFAEMVKVIPWGKLYRNRMFQNLVAVYIVYAAWEHRQAKSEANLAPGENPVEPMAAPITQGVDTSNPLSHEIQAGDTLFGLAQQFGSTVEALLEANPWISDRDLIHVGAKLVIPSVSLAEIPDPDPLRTIVGRPNLYKITERDISFLNWLNSTHSYWRDANGGLQRVYIPDWVYQYAKTAEIASQGRCPWNALAGIGLTESGYFNGPQWDPEAVSRAGAVGIMQFMPGTFAMHAPYDGAKITDPMDNFNTGCNKIIYQGLVFENTIESWVRNFFGAGPTGQAWNEDEEHGRNSWKLKEELNRLETTFNNLYEQVINE